MIASSQLENTSFYAYLPFVEWASDKGVALGPVIFWPASKYQEFLKEEDRTSFQKHLQALGELILTKEECLWAKKPDFDLNQMICLSISHQVSPELSQLLVIDALYLLYFAGAFRQLYEGSFVPSFHPFGVILPVSEILKNPLDWKNSFKKISNQERVSLSIEDQELGQALGKVLSAVYCSSMSHEASLIQLSKYLVRAVRYFIDAYSQRLIQLMGPEASENFSEPEEMVFLTSSFEVLLDIHDKQAAADFKQKVRPLLHLKWGRPVEFFWKWVDEFYEVKRSLIYAQATLDPLFRFNPNFVISHLFLGAKLFIYIVGYMLCKHNLLPAIPKDHALPLTLKSIWVEELLLFFWTEDHLLRKLNLFIAEAERHGSLSDELIEDIQLTIHLFTFMYHHYYLVPLHPKFSFIPTPREELLKEGLPLLKKLKDEKMKSSPLGELLLQPDFIYALEKRLK